VLGESGGRKTLEQKLDTCATALVAEIAKAERATIWNRGGIAFLGQRTFIAIQTPNTRDPSRKVPVQSIAENNSNVTLTVLQEKSRVQ